jgi:thioredoxin reductase (NADPH)
MCDQNITANSLLTNRVKENKKIAIVQDFPVTSIIQQPSGCYCLGSKGVRGFVTASGIFVAIGMEPNIDPIKFAHIYNNQGYILANERGVTPVQGFFAAGDVRVKSLRQSITAAADGANAVDSAIEYLRGR